MSCEESLFWADAQCDDWRSQAIERAVSAADGQRACWWTSYLAACGLSIFLGFSAAFLDVAACSRNDRFALVVAFPARFL